MWTDITPHDAVVLSLWTTRPKLRATRPQGHKKGVLLRPGELSSNPCRTAAPDIRDGLEVQRNSVQEQTHLYLPLYFQLGLETFTVTVVSSNIFHFEITRNLKKYFFTSLLHQYLINFKEWPRVRRDISRWNISSREIADKPCAILKTSVRSAQFRRSSNVQSLNWWSISSYHKDRKPGNNLVNLCCTFSKSSLSFI